MVANSEPTRKQISKRLRYEIMRRDNHTCRYCGGVAPDVKLTVDHVLPVALGGLTEAGNLVTACMDCNAGKSSSNPDAPLVEQVARDAAAWAVAIKEAAALRAAMQQQEDDYVEEVIAAVPGYRRLPANAASVIGKIYEAGLPVKDAAEAAGIAYTGSGILDRFAYFCGICWKRVRAQQEMAADIYAANREQK